MIIEEQDIKKLLDLFAEPATIGPIRS